jgi:hypothetical protein
VQLTLEQLLSVVGSLDDSPGFDTPRERFRRFITKRIATFAELRQLIEQCLQLPGMQSHRALEDLVLTVGRFLDFEIVFGSYERASILASGGWRARRQMFIHVAVWTSQTPTIDLAQLTSGNPKEGRAGAGEGESRVGLGIVTPLFPAATRLRDLSDNPTGIPVYALSLNWLLQLTEMVVEGRVNQSFIVALLTRTAMLDDLVSGLDALLNAPAAQGELSQ